MVLRVSVLLVHLTRRLQCCWCTWPAPTVAPPFLGFILRDCSLILHGVGKTLAIWKTSPRMVNYLWSGVSWSLALLPFGTSFGTGSITPPKPMSPSALVVDYWWDLSAVPQTITKMVGQPTLGCPCPTARLGLRYWCIALPKSLSSPTPVVSL